MKFVTFASTIAALLLVSNSAFAGHVQHDWAKVVRVEPIREVVSIPVDREVCRDVDVHHVDRHPGSATGTILGGIIGGVIGNQFGKGHGRDAATVAGVALGASIGRNESRKNRRSDRRYVSTETRCRVETDYRHEERTLGYDVTYRYRGETYSARMDEHPGERIRLRIEITPGY